MKINLMLNSLSKFVNWLIPNDPELDKAHTEMRAEQRRLAELNAHLEAAQTRMANSMKMPKNIMVGTMPKEVIHQTERERLFHVKDALSDFTKMYEIQTNTINVVTHMLIPFKDKVGKYVLKYKHILSWDNKISLLKFNGSTFTFTELVQLGIFKNFEQKQPPHDRYLGMHSLYAEFGFRVYMAPHVATEIEKISRYNNRSTYGFMEQMYNLLSRDSHVLFGFEKNETY